ncbi:MAG: hypothetical protein FWG71_09910, partial [Synergistaceae bacterium]|nr:hypothetical protein [Synergistaceae bacterium]
WAEVHATLPGAAAAVTRAVNGELGLRYADDNTPRFIKDMKVPGVGAVKSFDLDAFLTARGKVFVNSEDCAALVATFSNILGCSLSEIRIGKNFTCNFIKVIGSDSWENDEEGREYHEIAMEGAEGSAFNDCLVYDASLHLDGSATPGAEKEPEERQALLPAGMRFSKYADTFKVPRAIVENRSYREHLASNDTSGVLKCLNVADRNGSPLYKRKPVNKGSTL